MYRIKLSILWICATSALVLSARSARATPRPLPFTYTSETLAEGEVEVEQFADLTPVWVKENGNPKRFLASELQTEFEYGISDKLELGLYLSLVPQPTPPANGYESLPVMMWGNGLKQRLRYRLADVGEWPVDVALYGELSENEREFEIEAKVILQRRFGQLRAVANLWAERELYYDGRSEWVLNPTAGLTYEVTPSFHPGVEYWMRGEYGGQSSFDAGPHHYVGPAILVNFGRLWWSTGAYVRVSDFAREGQPGEAFGNVWFRTIVGIQL